MTSQVSTRSKPKNRDGNQSPETASMVGTPETSNLPNRFKDQKADLYIWFLCTASTLVQFDGCESNGHH